MNLPPSEVHKITALMTGHGSMAQNEPPESRGKPVFKDVERKYQNVQRS
jgi:hypothetical protein